MSRTPEEIVVNLELLSEEGKWRDARALLLEAQHLFPDAAFLEIWQSKLSPKVSLDTIPTGAKIYRKLLSEDSSKYEFIGTTPLKGISTYTGVTSWKIQKEGFESLEYVASELDFDGTTFRLFRPGELPANMLFVPSAPFGYWPQGWVSGIEEESSPALGEFLVDKYVVTNREYEEFVNSGGYDSPQYWREPIVQGEIEISWNAARTGFVDKTGKLGPSTWEDGQPPAGRYDEPVTGVSWYEAMAYARFRDKRLPTLFHWIYYGCPGRATELISLGNFSGEAPVPRSAHMGLGPYGTYDTAGNVREWCASQAHQSQDRFIQGGAWNEEPRNFVRARSIDPFDRSNTNGFRCIKPYEPAITVRTPPDRSERLNTSTAAFERFQKIFEFENTPFREQIEEIELHDPRFDCKKISLDSPWGEDRSKIFFLEPKRAQPPYQTILWLPSFWAYSLESFEKHFGQIRCRFDFLLRSGRAVAVMAMPGMYGRPPFDVEIPSDANERIAGLRRERSGSLEKFKERIFHRRSLTISVVREVKRLVDFLVEYPGIDSEKIGYHSVSLGGVLGPVIAANEQRISAAVWGFGGLGDEDLLPEIDPAVYLPRVTIPVLQLNAQYDYVFDRDNSSRPWLEYLGTDASSKRQLLYESGHSGPTESIMNRDSVAWLDLHLGRVATVS